jgi:hypothetical protein
MSKTNIFFAFDDGYNTSYIDSLIIGLFYDKEQSSNLLNINPNNNAFYYVQEMIKHDFIDAIHLNYSVSYNTINEFRNFLIACGWKNNENIINLYSVIELYDFFIDNLGGGDLHYDIYNILSGNVITHQINYFELKILESKTTTVNNLLQTWKEQNINNNKFKFINFPQIIPIYINRNNFLNVHVDVKKGIQFSGDIYNNMIWYISSIICFSNAEKQYYTIIRIKNEWYFFSNKNIPAMVKLNIKDNITAKKIQLECVLLFYVFNKIF